MIHMYGCRILTARASSLKISVLFPCMRLRTKSIPYTSQSAADSFACCTIYTLDVPFRKVLYSQGLRMWWNGRHRGLKIPCHGRHRGLKIPCPYRRAGSTPAIRTNPLQFYSAGGFSCCPDEQVVRKVRNSNSLKLFISLAVRILLFSPSYPHTSVHQPA